MSLSCKSIFSVFLFVQKEYIYLNLFTSFKIFGTHLNLSFGDATTGFLAKGRLRNECRNSILMKRHYLDLGSASNWLNQISHTARRFSDVIWRGKQQQRPQMSAVFSGFLHMQKKVLLTIFYNIYIYYILQPAPHTKLNSGKLRLRNTAEILVA